MRDREIHFSTKTSLRKIHNTSNAVILITVFYN